MSRRTSKNENTNQFQRRSTNKRGKHSNANEMPRINPENIMIHNDLYQNATSKQQDVINFILRDFNEKEQNEILNTVQKKLEETKESDSILQAIKKMSKRVKRKMLQKTWCVNFIYGLFAIYIVLRKSYLNDTIRSNPKEEIKLRRKHNLNEQFYLTNAQKIIDLYVATHGYGYLPTATYLFERFYQNIPKFE